MIEILKKFEKKNWFFVVFRIMEISEAILKRNVKISEKEVIDEKVRFRISKNIFSWFLHEIPSNRKLRLIVISV